MTKATGIVRKMDELGRVVLPMKLRRTLNINSGDSLEIFTDYNGEVILKKYHAGCISCGSFDNLKHLPSGDAVCDKCIKESK
jgi:transcriptional pleiotropic regulator of transition state genes